MKLANTLSKFKILRFYVLSYNFENHITVLTTIIRINFNLFQDVLLIFKSNLIF